MRLLELTGKGDIRLTGDEIANSPPYAILSHTWGPDCEEVTFQDINQGKEKKKVGFAKLQFCGEQAAKDGLRYFWVDTCCIDKSSSAELSESINSMFRYYKQASKCYVYLADVPKTSFEKSRWWTRGWTLQELVAPPEVDFFSSTKQKLGTKSTLERRITQVSGIPAAALRGTPMSEFSVGEKMGWAAKRNTKRPEDGAYCLFGMFDVSMPMIYGEGADQAFTRLNYEIERRLNPNRKSYSQYMF
ncbi:hypothetical protein Daus18300_003479 [Diaporthe australafricana]|uniref:Heterokaryon incompatibility domain-containing protein n=1 Tax=Diaporthe australafricana TaxID=127596 RepID=A0ABR3XER6_9PEZI